MYYHFELWVHHESGRQCFETIVVPRDAMPGIVEEIMLKGHEFSTIKNGKKVSTFWPASRISQVIWEEGSKV